MNNRKFYIEVGTLEGHVLGNLHHCFCFRSLYVCDSKFRYERKEFADEEEAKRVRVFMSDKFPSLTFTKLEC